jgi:acylphosphatase
MLGIEGFVRNQPDGAVFIEAQGEEKALEALTEWCHRGPDLARVSRVSSMECPPADHHGFEIRK